MTKPTRNGSSGRMSGPAQLMLTLALLAVLVFAWWQASYPTYRWAQRLDVTLRYEGVDYRGFGLTEAYLATGPVIDAPRGFSNGISGEAAFIDLPGPMAAVVLIHAIDSRPNISLALTAFEQAEPLGTTGFAVPRSASRLVDLACDATTISIPPEALPTVLLFEDVSDPTTGSQIHPRPEVEPSRVELVRADLTLSAVGWFAWFCASPSESFAAQTDQPSILDRLPWIQDVLMAPDVRTRRAAREQLEPELRAIRSHAFIEK